MSETASNDGGANEEERFDSDFTLMAGELAKLLGDLVDALGGEKNVESADEFKLRENGVAAPDDDPLYQPAVDLVVKHQRASISLIQRHLRIGYNRAAQILVWMEQRLIVAPMQANGTIPEKHVVTFKPGTRTNVEDEITLDRLECISQRENMMRNTLHRYPKEIAHAIQMRGALNRRINREQQKHR